MKVWCVPTNFPDPEKEPEQAEAARRFIGHMNGLRGMSMQNGVMLLTFAEIGHARAAKWKLEEFCSTRLEIIEGVLSEDNKKLDLHRLIFD